MPPAEAYRVLADRFAYLNSDGNRQSVGRDDPWPDDVPAKAIERGLDLGAIAKGAKAGSGDAWKNVSEAQMDAFAQSNTVTEYIADGSKAEKAASLETAGYAPADVETPAP